MRFPERDRFTIGKPDLLRGDGKYCGIGVQVPNRSIRSTQCRPVTKVNLQFDIIHTVVLILYIYLLEISVKNNNYCRSYSLYITTTCFGLNRPSAGPQELNYVLCDIFVNYAMGSHFHCSVNNCFKTNIKL
jgi:hypothetical protein